MDTMLGVAPQARRLGAALDAAACIAALLLLFTFQLGRVVVDRGVPSWVLLSAITALLGLSLAWRVLTRRLSLHAAMRAAIHALRARERVRWRVALYTFVVTTWLVIVASRFNHEEVPMVTQQRVAAHASLLALAMSIARMVLSGGVVEEVLRAGLAQRMARAAGSVQRYPWWALTASTLVWISAHAAYGYPLPQLAVVVGIGFTEAAAFRFGGLWTAVIPHAAFDVMGLI